MRTIPFKNILWAVAYKLGLDPKQSAFQDDQAQSIAEYANEWVRKVYPSKEFPEWTFTDPFEPANHVVTYLQDDILKIDKVFAVYLVDPATTLVPVETDYRLTPLGIHCGFDHGESVWVRYQGPQPEFTAEQWDGSRPYEHDNLTYSPITGECYKSKASGNVGHDPSAGTIIGNIVQTIQEFVAPQLAHPEQAKILELVFPNAGNPPPNGTLYSFKVGPQFPSVDPPYSIINYLADGVKPLGDIISELVALLATDLYVLTPPFTLNVPIPPLNSIVFTHLSEFNFRDAFVQLPGGGPGLPFGVHQIQSYLPAVPAVPGQPQITAVQLSTGSEVQPDAVYKLSLIDSSGVPHTVSYIAAAHDATPQVLSGLIAAISASTDPFFDDIGTSLVDNGFTLRLSSMKNFGANFSATFPGNPWWEQVLFPIAIADEVIMGVYGDTLKEWGQTQEGLLERTTAVAEADTTPSTRAQAAKSRYGL